MQLILCIDSSFFIEVIYIDWLKIKTEYISTEISLKDLAEKHNVNYGTLRKYSAKEQWQKSKEQIKNRTRTKTEEKIVNKKANQIAKEVVTISTLVEKMIEKADKIIEELDEHQLVETGRMKQVGVNATGQAIEQVVESKKIKREKGVIKTKEFAELAMALKNLDYIKQMAETSTEETPQIVIKVKNDRT